MGRIFRSKRKMPDGTTWISPRWYIEFTDGEGKQIQKSASVSKTESKNMLKELESQAARIKLGLEHVPKKNTSPTLKSLWTDYLADAQLRLRPKTLNDYQENYRALFDRKGVGGHPGWLKTCKKVSDLDPARIRRYQKDAIQAGLSARNVNKRLRTLLILLNWAIREEAIQDNPLQAVRMLPERPVEDRRPLTEEEVALLMEASSEHTGQVWQLLLHTGVRKGELTTLCWADIDLGAGTLEIQARNSKNHKPRTIPLSAKAREILEAWQDGQPPQTPVLTYIAGYRSDIYDGLGKTFKSICQEAEIAGISLHSLRRTFTVRLLERGINPAVVQALLGHSSVDLTLRVYGKARRNDIQTAISALDQ